MATEALHAGKHATGAAQANSQPHAGPTSCQAHVDGSAAGMRLSMPRGHRTPHCKCCELRSGPPGGVIARHVTVHLPTCGLLALRCPAPRWSPVDLGRLAGAPPGLPAAAGVGQQALPAAWQHRDPGRVRVPPQRAPKACPLGPACLLRLQPGGGRTPVTSRCPADGPPLKQASLLSGNQAVAATGPQENSQK